MKKCVFLVFVFAFAILPLTSRAEARIAPLRVVFISGSGEYQSDKTLPILKKSTTRFIDGVTLRTVFRVFAITPGVSLSSVQLASPCGGGSLPFGWL
ncbi:MAG: hypothetical protein HYX68_08380, partial [Planctomycetes bacterium]|nr:hypothetical protein [Planctomycetota bacterium]